LKEPGTAHWIIPNNGATNESGFTDLPGGDRYSNGTFHGIGEGGRWWSVTEFNASVAAYHYLDNYDPYLANNDVRVCGSTVDKTYGLSVRCIKD
jgi:uncharacterized protein (TIGR02145 family)